MPIPIKYQDENNNIFLGVDTSELTIRGVQNLVLELETCPRTEAFRSHIETSYSKTCSHIFQLYIFLYMFVLYTTSQM